MITALEARELVKTSDKEVNRILELLDVKIRKAAEAGSKRLACYEMGTWNARQSFESKDPTILQTKIIEELRKLGFHTTFGPDGEPYVPRGLQDNYDRGPFHTNYCITISW